MDRRNGGTLQDAHAARGAILSATLLAALVMSGFPWLPDAEADSFSFKAVVATIEDGDTLTVLRNNARIKVQIAGVDAPELDQPYGQEAKQLLTKLAKNQVVVVTTFTAGSQRGRLTGQIKLKDKRNVAKELLKAGLAWSMHGMGLATELDRIEAEAKAAGRGLWVDDQPIPPWDWRDGKRPIGQRP